jgi:hypothetical protein
MANFFGFFGDHQSPPPAPLTRPRFQPALEGLEDRCVMSAVSALKVPLGPPQHALTRVLETPAINAPAIQNLLKSEVAAQLSAQVLGTGTLNITGIDVDPGDLRIVDGVLQLVEGATATVTGTLAGLPFTAEITDFALELIPDGEGDGECAILDLALAPIDIDLLGLHVDTSPICLSITAFEGEGLLGDLLCGLAGGGLLGTGIPSIPTVGQLSDLADGLSDILTQALSLAGPAVAGPGVEDICDGECEILDLAVGPVDLTLLGLNVHLDDCTNGPVQVCVSASEGEGILGDLLCGLAGGGLLPNLPNLGELEELIGNILDELDLTNVTEKQLDKLVKQATKALRDGELTTNEIARLARSILRLA